MQDRTTGKHIVQAVPTVPPFAMPTWIRPLIGAGDDDAVLAGGWTSAKQFDVVTRAADGQHLVTRMSEEAIIDHADDRNKAAAVLENLYKRGLILLDWRWQSRI